MRKRPPHQPRRLLQGFTEANKIVTARLYNNELNLFRHIVDAAPNAAVAAIGYPHIFPANGSTCLAAGAELFALGFTPVTAKIEKDANTLVDNIDFEIQRAVKAYSLQVTFVDPRQAFNGHDVCANNTWITGVTYATNQIRSLHPNYNGNVAFAALLLLDLPG